eukprot:TRINITY_DN2200_c0_g1_i2.p1 TRINITY_DN2200_c0_g1~~TRINITY_DN2200_c0_g1_i2.p1  ORF type:complete len:269 (-),score=47.56 TRINITY_DN2200_c0_g1_i2:98-868(-)
MCIGTQKEFKYKSQLVNLLGTILGFQVLGLVIELGVALLPKRSLAPEIFSIILSVFYVATTSIGLHGLSSSFIFLSPFSTFSDHTGALHRKPDFLKAYALATVVTLIISVIMASMIAYLASLGVLVFSLESLDPSFLPYKSPHQPNHYPLQTVDDTEEFFFLRTNLGILIDGVTPDEYGGEGQPTTKRFQFLSILETHMLRNLLSAKISLWVIPTLWTIIQLALFILSVVSIFLAFEAASDILLFKKRRKSKKSKL